MIQLINDDGLLATPASAASKDFREWFEEPHESFLVAGLNEYGEGLTVRWTGRALTREQNQDLHLLLYAAREVGQIPGDTQSVLLPDGTEFQIDRV